MEPSARPTDAISATGISRFIRWRPFRIGVGAVKLALNVFDIKALVERLESKEVRSLYPPHDSGFFISTAINDPDGNYIEFTQLCDDWFRLLEERRRSRLDVVSRWKATKGSS